MPGLPSRYFNLYMRLTASAFLADQARPYTVSVVIATTFPALKFHNNSSKPLAYITLRFARKLLRDHYRAFCKQRLEPFALSLLLVWRHPADIRS